MSEKSVLLEKLIEKFEFKQITGNELSLKRPIFTAEISRPGFELAGFFVHSDFRRLIVFGEKEMTFISSQLTEEEQRKRFERLTDNATPAIIVTRGNECPKILKQIAIEKNFPIFSSALATGRMSVEVTSFLDEFLAPETTMHGVFVNIYGKGVIIKGESGIGKSEIALELIKKGHQLVADDCIELYHIGSSIVGKSPIVLENLLEIRGIGVIDVVKMFGAGSTMYKDYVQLIIQLERWLPSKEYTRIGIEEHDVTEEILDVDIPKIVVPVTGGRSMSAIIEAAVMNMRLKEMGYDSSKEFIERILVNIESNRQKEENS
jgi:Serine kinase of the HPr protein, regulates carbohydrate metabolism